jgi:hypothetical protein
MAIGSDRMDLTGTAIAGSGTIPAALGSPLALGGLLLLICP